MDSALAIGWKGKDKPAVKVTAEVYELQVAGNKQKRIPANPERAANIDLVDEATGAPLNMIRGYTKNGSETTVRPHFAFKAGFAPHEDHLFDNTSKENKNLYAAIDAGKQILLSVNTDLSYRPLNLRRKNGRGAEPIESWQAKNKAAGKGYLSVGVKSVESLIKKIHDIYEYNPDLDMDQTIFAHYRGAVLPYKRFYLGKRDQDISALYDGLNDGSQGVVLGKNKTRTVGTPRLFRFVVGDKTVKESGIRGIRGNTIKRLDGKILFSQLIFSNEKDKTSMAQAKIWNNLMKSDGEVYIWACPSINSNTMDEKWQQMRWIINNPELQIISVQRPEGVAPLVRSVSTRQLVMPLQNEI